MEQNQKKQQDNQTQSSGEQNPTLQQLGTQVADYGNVTGGSADVNVEGEKADENTGRSDAGSETVGNP